MKWDNLKLPHIGSLASILKYFVVKIFFYVNKNAKWLVGKVKEIIVKGKTIF